MSLKHRHAGIDLLLMTQHPSYLAPHIRKLVGRHEHIYRVSGFERVGVLAAYRCMENPNLASEKSQAEKFLWKYPRRLFKMYKSANVHLVKKTLPQPLKIGLVLVPSMLFFVVFMASKSFLGKMFFGSDADASVSKVSGSDSVSVPLFSTATTTLSSVGSASVSPFPAKGENGEDKNIPLPIRISGLASWGDGGTVIFEQGERSWRMSLFAARCTQLSNTWQCQYDGQTYRF